MTILSGLTRTQKVIAFMLIKGMSPKVIAVMLNKNDKTIDHHLMRMYRKAGITSGVKHIRFAVALTYELRPDLIPRPGFPLSIPKTL